MITIKYIDGTTENFLDANDYDTPEEEGQFLHIKKRKFDSEGDYDEDEDKVLGSINPSQIRSIIIK